MSRHWGNVPYWTALVAFIAIWFSAPALAGPSIVRGPYLQRMAPTGLVVRWRTDVATDSRLCIGSGPQSLLTCVVDQAAVIDHRVELSGLTPQSRYCYSVGSSSEVLAGGDEGTCFVTAPPIGTARQARIWVLGDSGTGTAEAAAVRDAYASYALGQTTDLWLMLGDNAYSSGLDSEYQTGLFAMYPDMLRQAALWPSIGNHDGNSADSVALTGPYFDNFSLPRAAQAGGVASGSEAYYSFDFGNIHFVVLDSNGSDRSPSGPMLSWLGRDLAASRSHWLIAYWHHPPFSHGSHNSDLRSDSGGRMSDMRENALPLLEQYGVDLVLSGHSHAYERTSLIDGHYGDSTTFSAGHIVDGGSGDWTTGSAYRKPGGRRRAHSGTVYVVAGSSGQLSAGTLDHPAMVRSLLALGSLVIDVAGNRLQVRFLDSNGTVRDRFAIIKPIGSWPALQPLILD